MFLFTNTEDIVRADAASKGSLSFTQNRDSVLDGDVIVVFESNQGTVTLNSSSGITRKTNTVALVEFDVDLLPTHKATLLGDRKKITVQWKASFAVPGGYYVEGDGYEGEFQIEGAAVTTDPFLAPLFTDSSGEYLRFYEVPYYAGAYSTLKTLYDNAAAAFMDCVWIDDSQGSSPSGSGQTLIPELNRIGFRAFGQPRKTPLARFGNFTSATLWLTRSGSAGATAGAEDIPGFLLYTGSNPAGSAGPLSTLNPDAGDQSNATDGIYFPATTNTLRWQVLIKRNASDSVEEARIVHLAGELEGQIFSGTKTRTEYNSSGLDLNKTDSSLGDYVIYESPNLTYGGASEPWHNMYVHGLDSSGDPIIGLQVLASRFVEPTVAGGICFSTISQGSATVDTHLAVTNLAGVGAAFSGDPINAVFVSLGTNDAGNVSNDPASWKTKLSNLVTKLKTDFPGALIVLLSEPPKWDFGVGAEDKRTTFERYAAVAGQLASESSGVAFLNLGRALYDVAQDFGEANGRHLSDTVHLTSASQAIQAQQLYKLMREIPG